MHYYYMLPIASVLISVCNNNLVFNDFNIQRIVHSMLEYIEMSVGVAVGLHGEGDEMLCLL